MPSRRTREDFLRKLSKKQPGLNVLSPYINCNDKIIVEDALGIRYYSIPKELLNGKVPTIKSAVCKNQCFIQRSRVLHGDKYDYSEVNYTKNNDKVLIGCPRHGKFYQTPNEHFNEGCGCPICANENLPGCYESIVKYNPSSSTNLYFIEISSDTEIFYKIGLSVNITNRFKQIRTNNNYRIKLLECRPGTASDLFVEEQELKNYFKQLKINYEPNYKFPGYTECFKW